MIGYNEGNLFCAKTDALAHGCNTLGRMNAGIAKQFKKRFPEMYKDYNQRCGKGLFLPGQGYLFKNPEKPHIINLGTQKDESARIEYVDSAFKWLADSYKELNIKSVAMPRIGSGLGGLEWDIVQDIIEEHFDDSDLLIEIWNI